MDKLAIIQSTSLTPIAKQAITELPAMVQKFVLAKDSEIIAQLTPLDMELYLLSVVTELQLNVGHTKKAEDGMSTELIAIAAANFIFETHKTLTKQELKLAILSYFIEKDVGQEGVSLKSIAAAIRGYLNDPLKIKTMAEWYRMIDLVKNQSKPETSPEQKEAVIFDGCIHFFNEYKNRNTPIEKNFVMPVDKVCSIFYETLEQKGFINFSKERKNEFSKKAEEIYKAQLEQAKLGRQIKASDYQAMMQTVTDNTNRPLKNLRRRLALMQFFDDLIEMDTPIETILTQ